MSTLPPQTSSTSGVSQLESKLGAQWSNMASATAAARRVKERLATELEAHGLAPADTAVVAFGSLARGEWTSGSDLDWTLLVDGLVDADHSTTRRHIAKLVKKLEYNGPGPTGVFGGLTFSHDIVHRIGGELDTNRNTTQRILLLLESTTLHSSAGVRERVISALLDRYVGEDLEYRSTHSALPRFLLNDIVRYWRTMAVDFAGKRQERGDGWALRNIKLRMSRKLVFSAGLWACIGCKTRPNPDLEAASFDDPEDFYAALARHLLKSFSVPPLEILADALLQYQAFGAAKSIFDSYDLFLGILNDAEKRNALSTLTPTNSRDSAVFREAREIAAKFQEGLSVLFFGTDKQLTTAVQDYGVF